VIALTADDFAAALLENEIVVRDTQEGHVFASRSHPMEGASIQGLGIEANPIAVAKRANMYAMLTTLYRYWVISATLLLESRWASRLASARPAAVGSSLMDARAQAALPKTSIVTRRRSKKRPP
jgi:hypothetical protein